MMASKIYTAQEMRNCADNCDYRINPCVSAMLRQAAEMCDRAEEVRARHSLYYGRVDYENETEIVDEVDYILRGAEGKEEK